MYSFINFNFMGFKYITNINFIIDKSFINAMGDRIIKGQSINEDIISLYYDII